MSSKHVTEQLWLPEQREDGVYLIAADDRTTILKLCRPDYGSDLLMAGYIAGLQAKKIGRETEVASVIDTRSKKVSDT
jgi:Ser/Thr protein kinase RdoA (MazF antagonist)